MIRTKTLVAVLTCLVLPCAVASAAETLPDEVRAQQVKDMKFGMCICLSFSTFSGCEWARGVEDVSYFRAMGCDTDQWCQVAKDAGMNYILFLTKHQDGLCPPTNNQHDGLTTNDHRAEGTL